MAEGVGGPAGVVGDLGLGPRGELQPEHGRPVSLLGQESDVSYQQEDYRKENFKI